VLWLTADVCRGNTRGEFGGEKPECRQAHACLRVSDRLTIRGTEHEGVDSGTAQERFAAVAGRPEVDVVARATRHDVAVRGTARRCAAVRSAEDDVATGTSIDDVVAIQSEDHVVTRPTDDHVGAIQRLVGDCAGLNGNVADIVIVLSDEDLRTAGTITDRSLRNASRAENSKQSGEKTEREGGKSNTRERVEAIHSDTPS